LYLRGGFERRLACEAALDDLVQQSAHTFRMRCCPLFQFSNQIAIQLAGKRDEALRLVELALFAAIELRSRRRLCRKRSAVDSFIALFSLSALFFSRSVFSSPFGRPLPDK
jgi:hypothetical protein